TFGGMQDHHTTRFGLGFYGCQYTSCIYLFPVFRIYVPSNNGHVYLAPHHIVKSSVWWSKQHRRSNANSSYGVLGLVNLILNLLRCKFSQIWMAPTVVAYL